MARRSLEQALALLGPLEARIMRVIWKGAVKEPFIVSAVRRELADLAYTTIMTTMHRLAEKGILSLTPVPGKRAYEYRAAMGPDEFLAWASRREMEQLIVRHGDRALAAFADRLGKLSPTQRERLRKLSGN